MARSRASPTTEWAITETGFNVRWFIAIKGTKLKLCEVAQFVTSSVSLWDAKGTALSKDDVLKAYESSNIVSEAWSAPFANNVKDQGQRGFGQGEAWGQFKTDTTLVILDRHQQYVPYYRDAQEDKKYYAYSNQGDFVLKVRNKATKDVSIEKPFHREGI